MNEVWMLDYLNAVFPWMGFFTSEEAAWDYVDKTDHDRRDLYTPFKISNNDAGKDSVNHTAPFRRYANSR